MVDIIIDTNTISNIKYMIYEDYIISVVSPLTGAGGGSSKFVSGRKGPAKGG